MMLFMHGGHKGHDHGQNKGHDHAHNHSHNHSSEHNNPSSEVKSLDNYKIKQLEGEIEFLKIQNEKLQKKVDNFTHNVSQK
jgi:predicted RNase H-like nuclease (RuvC/YqgF family)